MSTKTQTTLTCDICKKTVGAEMKSSGESVYLPPGWKHAEIDDGGMLADKYDICPLCWAKLKAEVGRIR